MFIYHPCFRPIFHFLFPPLSCLFTFSLSLLYLLSLFSSSILLPVLLPPILPNFPSQFSVISSVPIFLTYFASLFPFPTFFPIFLPHFLPYFPSAFSSTFSFPSFFPIFLPHVLSGFPAQVSSLLLLLLYIIIIIFFFYPILVPYLIVPSLFSFLFSLLIMLPQQYFLPSFLTHFPSVFRPYFLLPSLPAQERVGELQLGSSMAWNRPKVLQYIIHRNWNTCWDTRILEY